MKFRPDRTLESPRVESVALSGVQKARRGKHFGLMQEVLRGLESLSRESALKVPLGLSSAKDLRSAVVRVAHSRNIEIASRSDLDYLYVWKKDSLREENASTPNRKPKF